MTIFYAFVACSIVGCALFMILSRNLVRMLLGFSLLATGTNLLLFVAGRIRSQQPPIIGSGQDVLGESADPVIQALILTAIVIGLGLTVMLGVLVLRAWRARSTIDARDVDAAEAVGRARPQDPADG